jgi:uncharacterized damage-inducible protein DinB
MLGVHANTERYLEGLSAQELARQIVVPWEQNTEITVEKALIHMVLEDMVHYGELSASLWQIRLEAPYIGFWRYGISEPVSASFETKIVEEI